MYTSLCKNYQLLLSLALTRITNLPSIVCIIGLLFHRLPSKKNGKFILRKNTRHLFCLSQSYSKRPDVNITPNSLAKRCRDIDSLKWNLNLEWNSSGHHPQSYSLLVTTLTTFYWTFKQTIRTSTMIIHLGHESW